MGGNETGYIATSRPDPVIDSVKGDCRPRRAGLEPLTFGSVDRCSESASDAATTGYDKPDSALTDLLTDILQKHPDSETGLRVVIRAWPELPEAVRAGIVAMVKAANL